MQVPISKSKRWWDLRGEAEAERAAMVAGLTEDMRAAFEELSR